MDSMSLKLFSNQNYSLNPFNLNLCFQSNSEQFLCRQIEAEKRTGSCCRERSGFGFLSEQAPRVGCITGFGLFAVANSSHSRFLTRSFPWAGNTDMNSPVHTGRLHSGDSWRLGSFCRKICVWLWEGNVCLQNIGLSPALGGREVTVTILSPWEASAALSPL